MQKEELLLKFKQFCNGLGRQDRVAIIHHSDADGFCSALITAKAVEKLSGRKILVVQPYEYGNRAQWQNAVKRMKKDKINTLVVLDIGIDSSPKKIEEQAEFEKCLIIDHHKMYKDLNSEKVLFLKSGFFTEKDASAYATSKFAFDLFSQVTDIAELDWIACIGIIGDMGLKHWEAFVQETIKRRNLSLTSLYRFNDLIGAIEVFAAEKMPQLFWAFYEAKNPADILESNFQKYLEDFRKEKDFLIEGFEKGAEKFPEIELCFYYIKSEHENIKSYVINELSGMHPSTTLILFQDLGGDRIRFSARRPDFKVKANDLLVEAVKGIPDSSAGGHAPAAAGSMPKKYLKKFKKSVIRILKTRYRKKLFPSEGRRP